MDEQLILKFVIYGELDGLKTKLEETNVTWEIEKYENQIDILEKVLKEAEIN